MLSMKKIFIIGGIIFSLTACQNKSTTTVGAEKDSTTIPDKDGTDVELDTIPATASENVELTAEELKDDKVFSDGSEPTTWENAGINDPTALKIFIKKLQNWVSADQRDSVAAAIDYPLMNNKTISDSKIFLSKYDQLMTAEVVNALKTQKLNQLFRNSQGVMIGNIWVSDVSGDGSGNFKIISINN
jgi:hypothetical protein